MHGTKSINYGTPKSIQMLKAKDDTRRHSTAPKKCKATKSVHVFDQWVIEYLSFTNHKIPFCLQSYCRCGKKGRRYFEDEIIKKFAETGEPPKS